MKYPHNNQFNPYLRLNETATYNNGLISGLLFCKTIDKARQYLVHGVFWYLTKPRHKQRTLSDRLTLILYGKN